MNATSIKVRASYYQQFDADYNRDVPAEGYGGWGENIIEISRQHTAFVIMHAWETGTYSSFPGWHRAVEYIPRAKKICDEIFPQLFMAVRKAKLPVFHVVGGGEYYKSYPGYAKTLALTGSNLPKTEFIKPDKYLENLRKLKHEKSFPGKHNEVDIKKGFSNLTFPKNAEPVGDEYIVENGHQLFHVCRHCGINHLIYTGFAINWCLLLSPGGMHEMSSYGIMCSVVKEAVTAVENKESARHELHKEEGLWRVAIAFGFVFSVKDLIDALSPHID